MSDIEEPNFSVAICAFNAEKRLPLALEWLAKVKFPGNCEVLVVDNASTDATSEMARSWTTRLPNLRIVREETPGLAHARMRAFREARGRFVCFVDDDNLLAEDYLAEAYSLLERMPHVAILTGRSILKAIVPAPAWFAEMENSFAVGDPKQIEGELKLGATIWGAGLIVRRSAFFEIRENGFAPLLTGRIGRRQLAGEDSELCLALAMLGWTAYFLPSLVLRHAIDPKRFTLDALKETSIGFGQSRIYLEAYRSRFQRGLRAVLKRSDILFASYVGFTFLRAMIARVFDSSVRSRARFWVARGMAQGYFVLGMRPSTVFKSAFVRACSGRAARGAGN